ncbi:MAG: hypothetical protein HKP14_04535 [Bacteroidia bacterium]|nr:hypothetical protein [Bacteroidia bacterium]
MLHLSCKDNYKYNEDEEIKAITRVLSNQTDNWNKGNHVGYMEGYKNSGNLKLYSRNGCIYGWNNV